MSRRRSKEPPDLYQTETKTNSNPLRTRATTINTNLLAPLYHLLWDRMKREYIWCRHFLIRVKWVLVVWDIWRNKWEVRGEITDILPSNKEDSRDQEFWIPKCIYLFLMQCILGTSYIMFISFRIFGLMKLVNVLCTC